jgi:putative sigma-54 modulation protein
VVVLRFDIRGKNIEVTEALKEYVEKRLSKLERFIEDVRVAQVTLSVEGESHKVEVTIPRWRSSIPAAPYD